MGKAGFEIEIGGMQFDGGFENSRVLAVFEREENGFFRIEAEGQKVLKGKSAYPEIVSVPFETKKDIRFFFGVMKKFCKKAGEKTFGESIKMLEDVESHERAATGTKASSAKLKFDVLIKTSQAEVLKELFTEAEREILLAVLDYYKDFWGKKFENISFAR